MESNISISKAAGGGLPWHSSPLDGGPSRVHGCVRLYEENVQEMFEMVRVGTSGHRLP